MLLKMAHRRPLMAHSATSGGIGVPSDGIQYATQGRTLDATNSIQSATDGSIPMRQLVAYSMLLEMTSRWPLRFSARRQLQFLIAK